MAFGVYVHIPYCLQRCTYCDFATYERSKIFPSNEYVDLVLEEMSQRAEFFGPRPLDTIYFGGGTPSLLPPHEIIAIINGLEKLGFVRRPAAEVTIEINPATISHDKLQAYLDNGINRFSVGAQTFDDKLLKMVKREHNAKQTLETLELLRSKDVNFSFDILFALPTQTIEGLKRDLAMALDCGSRHISPYCLTVPEGHPLSRGRAPEDEQVDMFELLREGLIANGFHAYEISNFAKPGFESRHNILYWTDQEYWSLGLSAHSYSKATPWGTRFWNKNAIGEYRSQIEAAHGKRGLGIEQSLEPEQFELLEPHQALTDLGHTALRMSTGLTEQALRGKFPAELCQVAQTRLEKLTSEGFLEHRNGAWSLTTKGVVVSNHVFREMTFLRDELELPSR